MILGLQKPQIVVGGSTTEFEFAEMQPDFLTPLVVEYVSPLNGDRNFIYVGDYARFRIQINLFQFSDPAAKLDQLKALEKQLCVFYPHQDGQSIKDKFGNSALFFISKVNPFYLDNEDDFDMVEMTFDSVGFVDYTGAYNVLGFGYQFGYSFGYGV